METGKIIYKNLSFELNGVLFKTHNELGRFCNEKQYSDKIESLLKQAGIRYEREKIIPVSFEGERPGRNKADFLIEDKIILEVKTVRVLDRECYYQIQRYLAAMNLKLGILVNFQEKFLKPRRVLNSSAKE